MRCRWRYFATWACLCTNSQPTRYAVSAIVDRARTRSVFRMQVHLECSAGHFGSVASSSVSERHASLIHINMLAMLTVKTEVTLSFDSGHGSCDRRPPSTCTCTCTYVCNEYSDISTHPQSIFFADPSRQLQVHTKTLIDTQVGVQKKCR